LLAKKNTCKKTGVSATRDAGDEIVCAAMRVLLLRAAFESCRSSVSLPVAFAGINPFFFFTSFFALSARSLSYYTALLQKVVSQSVTTTLLAGSSWTTHTLLFFYFEYGDNLCNVVFLSLVFRQGPHLKMM